MFKLFLICFAIAIFHSGSAQIVWKDCGSKNGVLSSLEVEGCTATPCILKKGTEASMTVKFKQSNFQIFFYFQLLIFYDFLRYCYYIH